MSKQHFLNSIRFIAIALGAFVFAASAAAQTKLLRFPDIHGDRVVFTYGGDLWTAPSAGGAAIRLTSHPGIEVFGKFSPDGKWIAFTGQYDGDEQVYVVSSMGGIPRQLTFYPAKGPLTPRWGWDHHVHGWSRDGKRILFRAQRDSWALPIARLYSVSVEGGPAEALPMPAAGSGDYSPDGAQIAYSPQSRDFRSEKRYGGGQANALYIFDLKTFAAKKITEGPRPTRDPMWVGNTVYFNSDRDGHFNLYAYGTSDGKTTQVTNNKTWDVRWPSSDNEGRIVYELNGELQVLDARSGRSNNISISVPDEGLALRPSRIPVASFMESVGLSPKGERALFNARGDVFTAPIEKGPTRNLTHSSGAHDKWPSWSPDGSRIAFISDMSGEEELYIAPQDGLKPAEQITRGGKAMRYQPEWAPDGKRIAFSDKDGKLYVVTLADKKVTEIVDSKYNQIRDYTWSPRGNFLAYSTPDNPNRNSSIFIWSAADGRVRRVTDEMFNAQSPAWDPAGNYIYYLSDREFQPQISQIEFNYATNRTSYIYAMALRKDVKHPFPPESDEVTIAKEETAKPKGEPGEDPKPPAKDINRELKDPAKSPTPEASPAPASPSAAAPSPEGAPAGPKPPAPTSMTVDFDGITARAARVPVGADNYGGLSAKTGHLIYAAGSAFFYGRQGDRPTNLKIFAFKDRKEATIAEDIRGYVISDDGSKLLVAQGPGYNLYDATPVGDKTRKPVLTTGLFVDRIPSEEWNQIFHEVWRRYRDWFYVPNMHGYDWVALREQYKPLLQYVSHRSDLNYVIGEMISELTVQHAYIEGGDFTIPPRPRSGLPGARFEVENGRYRVAKIFQGQNEEDIYRSPLTEIGVDVKVGDYVLAIDGEELKATDDIYRLLRNKADNPVSLTVNKTPSMTGARIVSYRPVTSEELLVYLDWVSNNRRKVDQATGGRVGYIHIPDMGNNGIREFIKWYYPQIRKEGLVVDVRANGGGNVSRMLIERLRRKLLAVNYSRTDDEATTYPDQVFIGPMVTLLDQNSSSDGDIFPYMFREAGLGPLIGKRSWGGVVGIQGRGPLIDGGTVFVPGSGLASKEGQWIIEGYGVDPDIEVENDPKSEIEGRDPQLERGISEVMAKLKTPVKLPAKPAGPVKTIK
ncbi:MAG: PD40 domain-containing protein [Pyrinomonadaceae bacterium]|nr:PD40 domain-containing protein [Pyrinomonadaceae bacterium]